MQGIGMLFDGMPKGGLEVAQACVKGHPGVALKKK
jgi:hypothetical protein